MEKTKKSYAVQVSNAQVMMAALKTNQAQLAKRGITTEFVTVMDKLLSNTTAQNSKQEKLKADLKTCTAELESMLVQLQKMMSESTTVVKLEMPKEQWKEFGITATR